MTVREALQKASESLRQAGVSNPRRDARILVAAAMGCQPGDLIAHPEAELASKNLSNLECIIARRTRREPVSRILGAREFWSLSFELSGDTLDPRPDSETLIEAVLEELPDKERGYSILDLGTGTGCLLLSLLKELPASRGLGVDVSCGAVATACRNAVRLKLADRASFLQGHWTDALGGHWDIIVANPPYVSQDELPELEPEVRLYDPVQALIAGEEGLAAYREILSDVGRLLSGSGLVAIEIGLGQIQYVAEIATAMGLEVARTARDLQGIDRCLIVRRKGSFSAEKKGWNGEES